jgi:hypothetical protein
LSESDAIALREIFDVRVNFHYHNIGEWVGWVGGRAGGQAGGRVQMQAAPCFLALLKTKGFIEPKGSKRDF